MESKLKLPLSGVRYNKNGGYISIQQLVRSNVIFFLDGGGGGWGRGVTQIVNQDS